ncbi:hypothetical protein ES708_01542 [subsurface metagenome]
MIYKVDFHIPGEIPVGAGSPEEARQTVAAMDAQDLAPYLGWTVVDTVSELDPKEE